MSDMLFDSRTPRHDLPLLFAGQTQREGFVNEALARIDALLHGAIEAQLAAPPAAPAEGQCWLVASGSTGTWAGHDGEIAAYESGNWLFFLPRGPVEQAHAVAGHKKQPVS